MKKIFIFLILILGNYVFADCPEVLDHEVRLLDSSETVNLCQYEDKVILAVNVASRCGFTYQYEQLESLQRRFKDKKFTVLGFPSRNFLGQEFNDEEKVSEFCKSSFDVSFPLFSITYVKNSTNQPF